MGSKPPSWRRELQDILNQHNERHALKPKAVSFKTMHERATFLFAFFTELRHNEERKYKVQPSGLRTRHIAFMVSRWLRRGLAPATIQLNLSYLRVFAGWIGKAGLVVEASFYVHDEARVRRHYAAASDRSWSARGLDPNDTIACISEADIFVAAQLAMCAAFGLRVKEAIMFQPLVAVSEDGSQICPLRGTKGGRERRVPIDSDAKRAALELARRVAVVKTAHLGNPQLTLQQNYRRFYRVLARFGITKRDFGVTAHGLRHQYGNDRYEQFAGAPSPVRQGPKLARRADRAARLRVAAELGHARESITIAYLGGIRRPAADAPSNGQNPCRGRLSAEYDDG